MKCFETPKPKDANFRMINIFVSFKISNAGSARKHIFVLFWFFCEFSYYTLAF